MLIGGVLYWVMRNGLLTQHEIFFVDRILALKLRKRGCHVNWMQSSKEG